jgi:glycosyltransferase involved in cell wall biosynthesis
MICILHGYLLDGSGSNLWTQSIIRTLCRAGETVHLMCQEPHPEKFDYVARAVRYDAQLEPEVLLDREIPGYPGRCIMHKPTLGDVLPVYVWDHYEEFDQVVPMAELDDAVVDDYMRRNEAALDKIVAEHGVTALHANHAVLQSVVAQRVAARHQIPFTIMPHGSAIEYAVKKSARLHELARGAFDAAGRIFVIGPEIRQRVQDVFTDLPDLSGKLIDLNLGVDTGLFEPLDPAQRGDNIAGLGRALEGVPRGKQPEQSAALLQRLEGCGDDLAQVKQALADGADYTAKYTDADCEAALARVDWGHDRLLLFVGRLIASKGIHGVVAALPSILQSDPNTRLVVVGHGPLREPLEAMIWALEQGDRALFERLVAWGAALEDADELEPAPFIHIQRYLEQLEQRGELERYFETARTSKLSERVIFTGYLTHRELRYLFPCCDAALFPSIVAEAGPLVFLEALASGVFPLGIYHAGMAASIDSVAGVVPDEVVELMKLRQDPLHTVADMVSGATGALALQRAHAADLRKVAVERYDWKAVGQKLLTTLVKLGTGSGS